MAIKEIRTVRYGEAMMTTDGIVIAVATVSRMATRITGNIEVLRCTDATDIVWLDAIIGVTGSV